MFSQECRKFEKNAVQLKLACLYKIRKGCHGKGQQYNTYFDCLPFTVYEFQLE